MEVPVERVSPQLAVASLTFNRPSGLRALLEAWAVLETPVPTVFIVVDNSHDGNGRSIVEEAMAARRIDLRYVHEPKRGISAGRNRAVVEARALGADVLAFVDDDETPAPDWIVRLLEVKARTGADAVAGRVNPVLPPTAPEWIKRGRFFNIEEGADGAELSTAATCNVMFDLDVAARLGLDFDSAFGLSGGEDTLFFRRMYSGGGRIVFADRAIVHDVIPPERARLAWLARRWRRTGNTDARIRMKLYGASHVRTGVSGAVRCAIGILLLLAVSPAALVGRFDVCARALRIMLRGAGYVSAAAGESDLEYKSPRSQPRGITTVELR